MTPVVVLREMTLRVVCVIARYETTKDTRALKRLAGLHATRQQLLLSSELRSLW